MVLQSDIDLIEKMFIPAKRYNGRNWSKKNITSYRGKHILENIRKEGYMSDIQFSDCMEFLNVKPFKNTLAYPISLKKEYSHLYLSM